MLRVVPNAGVPFVSSLPHREHGPSCFTTPLTTLRDGVRDNRRSSGAGVVCGRFESEARFPITHANWAVKARVSWANASSPALPITPARRAVRGLVEFIEQPRLELFGLDHLVEPIDVSLPTAARSGHCWTRGRGCGSSVCAEAGPSAWAASLDRRRMRVPSNSTWRRFCSMGEGIPSPRPSHHRPRLLAVLVDRYALGERLALADPDLGEPVDDQVIHLSRKAVNLGSEGRGSSPNSATGQTRARSHRLRPARPVARHGCPVLLVSILLRLSPARSVR